MKYYVEDSVLGDKVIRNERGEMVATVNDNIFGSQTIHATNGNDIGTIYKDVFGNDVVALNDDERRW